MSDPNAPIAPYRTPLAENPPIDPAIGDLRHTVILLTKRLDDLEAYLRTLSTSVFQLLIQRIKEDGGR